MRKATIIILNKTKMKDIQEVFSQIKEITQEQKEIRREYKDTLSSASNFEELVEKIEELKQEKKNIEERIQEEMGSRWEKLEQLKSKSSELKQMQSDIAVSTIMGGKTVEVKDEFNNIYEPVFAVTFKKTGVKSFPENSGPKLEQ